MPSGAPRTDEPSSPQGLNNEENRPHGRRSFSSGSRLLEKSKLQERLDGGNSAKPSRELHSKPITPVVAFVKINEDAKATPALNLSFGAQSKYENGRMTGASLGSHKLGKQDLENGLQANRAADVRTQYNSDISTTSARDGQSKERFLKLSPDKLVELISSADALPLQISPSFERKATIDRDSDSEVPESAIRGDTAVNGTLSPSESDGTPNVLSPSSQDSATKSPTASGFLSQRPSISSRAVSTPLMKRKQSSNKTHGITPLSIPTGKSNRQPSGQLNSKDLKVDARSLKSDDLIPSPLPQSFPIPPLSVPTHLQLELSSNGPSPLYIYKPSISDYPYEPSHVKLERLLNFLLLPPQLEQVLCFGALACLDAWLYTFTILPLRFFKALSVLFDSWLRNIWAEATYVIYFIYIGAGRMWRRRKVETSTPTDASKVNGAPPQPPVIPEPFTEMPTPGFTPSDNINQRDPPGKRLDYKHRRTRSGPSNLQPIDKADILKGLLILISCYMLMYFDASMMYHNIRGQAAIKLYVIYNALEVFDRLLSALGQDVLECLFAKETLERKPNGRSKILRPFWLFSLALVYNIIHSLCLFYQVITLNVAVNSYSNALLTLLMSNQFVEIKSTVFKKIEKENLFQMTCADIVERFQLWLMLIIIASRNIVETGGLSGASGATSSTPDRSSSLLPHSFTLLPDWIGQVMGPFFLVLGTEMLVDWVKHAYITKFNNTKPNIYGRFLDVLTKDFYSNAFSDPNLTRRVGLATIPLSCLFIRASLQTYHMFLATHTLPAPPTTTSLTDESFPSPKTTPAITAAIQHIDRLFKRAIFGAESSEAGPEISIPWLNWLTFHLPSSDTVLNYLTKAIFFAIFFLVLLILKILLGMILLSYARARYASMKQREQESSSAEGKRLGGGGVTELGDDKRRWIYEDDAEGLRKMRDREKDTREKEAKGEGKSLGSVERYAMVAKRIW